MDPNKDSHFAFGNVLVALSDAKMVFDGGLRFVGLRTSAFCSDGEFLKHRLRAIHLTTFCILFSTPSPQIPHLPVTLILMVTCEYAYLKDLAECIGITFCQARRVYLQVNMQQGQFK